MNYRLYENGDISNSESVIIPVKHIHNYVWVDDVAGVYCYDNYNLIDADFVTEYLYMLAKRGDFITADNANEFAEASGIGIRFITLIDYMFVSDNVKTITDEGLQMLDDWESFLGYEYLTNGTNNQVMSLNDGYYLVVEFDDASPSCSLDEVDSNGNYTCNGTGMHEYVYTIPEGWVLWGTSQWANSLDWGKFFATTDELSAYLKDINKHHLLKNIIKM